MEYNVWGVTYRGCCLDVRVFDKHGNLKNTISDDKIRQWSRDKVMKIKGKMKQGHDTWMETL